jgi:hypothetical protein
MDQDVTEVVSELKRVMAAGHPSWDVVGALTAIVSRRAGSDNAKFSDLIDRVAKQAGTKRNPGIQEA